MCMLYVCVENVTFGVVSRKIAISLTNKAVHGGELISYFVRSVRLSVCTQAMIKYAADERAL